jgi:BlaI family transcriptional regulator, penicillinase repressor
MVKKAANDMATARMSDHHLPAAELEVLACLWQEGEATARRIREMMKRYRPMAHGSVVTLLMRLESKGLVSKEKGPVGKAFVFKSVRRPDATYRILLRDMLIRVFGGDMVKMATAMIEAQPPTMEEVRELQTLFGRLKGKKRPARG